MIEIEKRYKRLVKSEHKIFVKDGYYQIRRDANFNGYKTSYCVSLKTPLADGYYHRTKEYLREADPFGTEMYKDTGNWKRAIAELPLDFLKLALNIVVDGEILCQFENGLIVATSANTIYKNKVKSSIDFIFQPEPLMNFLEKLGIRQDTLDSAKFFMKIGEKGKELKIVIGDDISIIIIEHEGKFPNYRAVVEMVSGGEPAFNLPAMKFKKYLRNQGRNRMYFVEENGYLIIYEHERYEDFIYKTDTNIAAGKGLYFACWRNFAVAMFLLGGNYFVTPDDADVLCIHNADKSLICSRNTEAREEIINTIGAAKYIITEPPIEIEGPPVKETESPPDSDIREIAGMLCGYFVKECI